MKRIFLTLIILLTAQITYAASENPSKEAMANMIKSHEHYHNACVAVAKNFNYDHKFSSYLKNKCLLFESDRERIADVVFPISNQVGDDYKKNYAVLKSQFLINLNNRELENHKALINEYCKYNAYKFEKKAPQTCNPQRINSLFGGN